jgi:hypothetical protein
MRLEMVKREESLTKDEFLKRYKSQNTPVILENLSRDWPARDKWTLDYLCSVVGDNVVPLYGGGEPAKGHRHQHAHVAEMTFREFIAALQQGENKLRMFFYNILEQAPQLMQDFSFPDMGLKLFKRLPVMFFGGKGAKVQMHFDIDYADLLLCHFGGKKRVYLFGPEQSKNLYHVPYSFSSLFDVDVDQPDFERFPALRKVEGQLAELNHGDVLYIPPGFWHYIIYDEVCFSLSLRALPRNPRHFAKLMYNIFYVRTVDGLMRRWVGQPWNDKNERRAYERTSAHLSGQQPN